MKVILGCDPLLMPLTGIGHYTKALANGLNTASDIEQLNFFAHGQFFPHGVLNQLTMKVKADGSMHGGSFITKLRQKMSSSILAVKGYQAVMPHVESWRLKSYSDCLFHAPNFVLPNFSGKKVVTVHDLSTVKYPEFHPISRVRFVNHALEYSLANADHIITDSNFIKQEIEELFPNARDRVTAIPLGVDHRFKPRGVVECTPTLSQYQLSYRQFFLFVSTLEPRKNVLRILQAYEAYRQSVSHPLPLVMIGGQGWNNQEEWALIQRFQAKGWVRHLGYISDQQLPIFFSAATAVVFPSLYEGFGLPVAEGIQSGTPVITSKHSAMSEFAVNAELLVDPLDTDELVTKMVFVAESFTADSHQNVKRPLPHFSWSEMTQKTIDVYKKVYKK